MRVIVEAFSRKAHTFCADDLSCSLILVKENVMRTNNPGHTLERTTHSLEEAPI